MTKANNEIFMEAINKIIYNIDNFNFLYDKYKKQVTKKKPYYGTLNITGPNLLYKSSINKINYKKNVKLIHVVDGDYNNYRNLKIMYNNKLFALKNYSSWKPSGSHYNKLWLKKEVIYYDEFKYLNFRVLIYPNYNFNIIIDMNNEKINIKNNNNSGNEIIFKIICEKEIFYKKIIYEKPSINFFEILE